MRQFKLTIIVLLFIFSDAAFALSCGSGWDEKVAFEEAKYFFVIRVTSVALDEEFLKSLETSSDSENIDEEQPAIINTYQYEIIEKFKGAQKTLPNIYSIINIGAGSANLLPGAFYLLSVSESGVEFNSSAYHFISYCDVHAADLSPNSEKFSEQVEVIRNLAKQ